MAAPRPAPRAAGRAAAGHPQRDHRAAGLPAARRRPRRDWRARRMAAPRRPGAGGGLAVCAGPRLSQDACASACSSSPIACRREVGPFGHRVFTDSAPVLEVELASRSGIGWRGKHTLALDRDGGLDVLPRRDLRRPRAAADRAGGRPLRQLQCLHRRLPDRGDRRAVPARRAALHLLPDDRARRADPGRIARRHRQPHLRLRRLPAGLSVEQVRAAQRAARFRRARRPGRPDAARSCGAGARPTSCATPKAARSAASAGSAGAATWRWRWATCCAHAAARCRAGGRGAQRAGRCA